MSSLGKIFSFSTKNVKNPFQELPYLMFSLYYHHYLIYIDILLLMQILLIVISAFLGSKFFSLLCSKQKTQAMAYTPSYVAVV
jgi:hypothetical protein